jgi:hypothetical protein
VNNVRCKNCTTFRKKKREYLNEKLSMKQTQRIKISESNKEAQYEHKKGYQPRNNLVKDENGERVADSHYILNR